jgi:hypothetical protein
MVSDGRSMMNRKGSEEKRSWLNLDAILAFAWRDWGKPR